MPWRFAHSAACSTLFSDHWPSGNIPSSTLILVGSDHPGAMSPIFVPMQNGDTICAESSKTRRTASLCEWPWWHLWATSHQRRHTAYGDRRRFVSRTQPCLLAVRLAACGLISGGGERDNWSLVSEELQKPRRRAGRGERATRSS